MVLNRGLYSTVQPSNQNMQPDSAYQAYLSLADELFGERISERDLPDAIAQLFPLDQDLLNSLVQFAENLALTEPRRGWAVLRLADESVRRASEDPGLSALTAWYLGRACNHWVQPERVQESITRARAGFERLNQPGWIAACDWQLNTLSWTKPDFTRAASALEQALLGLQDGGAELENFVPHCRLALSYAQILIGKFDLAIENILLSEQAFIAQGDDINQARCWLNKATRLRNLSKFDDAMRQLQEARRVFNDHRAPLEAAKADYQLGVVHLQRTDDLAIASAHLERAAQAFAKGDLDLWQAACLTNLGAIHNQDGQLAKAEAFLEEARAIFSKHAILGSLAGNFNDSGKLATLRGSPKLSLEYFKQAEELFTRLGDELDAAIVTANIGEAYGQLGQYQDALRNLEKATDRLIPFGNGFRLGTCENFIALIWWRLGQFSLAHEHLDKAAAYYREVNQIAYLSQVYNFRAEIFVEQGELEKAIACLGESVKFAHGAGIRPQAALAQRLLGEACLLAGQNEDAKEHLEQALVEFSAMEMTMEQAATQVALGGFYSQISVINKARKAYKAALLLSKNSFPEIDWRAHIGLADLLGRAKTNSKTIIREYRLGAEALSRIRLNFWQPALAGSYIQSPALIYDKAIALAVNAHSAQDALGFIEDNKAITLVRQLSAAEAFSGNKSVQEMSTLRAEIYWLQEQMRASSDRTVPIPSLLRTRHLQAQLAEKARQYDARMARLERQGVSDQAATILPLRFDLSLMRKLINRVAGKSWVALDYYLLNDELIIVEITPGACRVHTAIVSSRFKLALDECLKARRNSVPPQPDDLIVLGDALVPASVLNILTSDTYLLLSPHKILHGLPWGAIQPVLSSQPLASFCIPCTIPSLHSLALLCERFLAGAAPGRDGGLVVGLSRFQGAHEALPHTGQELEALSRKLGPAGETLRETAASWENLWGLAAKPDADRPAAGLARFAWLHIASHVFPDDYTGRLSGIALWDGDISIDQLRDLAPLPRLVTFSACDSIYSLLHPGDEHVGLPTSCLMAGANSVLGSVWPIPDRPASQVMTVFYEYYLQGMHPAQALAKAQRQAISRGAGLADWASYVCVGVP
jgi:tetratricopeptide (TPR) repeat protein